MAFKSTSVKGTNVAILDQSGKVGTIRYYVRNGRTYVRAAACKSTAKSNPRSDAQMNTRLKHNSMLAIWKVLQSYMEGSFKNKEVNQTDYNAFMQQNAGSGVYMTKQQYAQGCGIALPVIVSNGSLPGLDAVKTASGIEAVLSHNCTSASTLGAFSQSVIDNNPGWQDGDIITAFLLSQDINYKLSVTAYQITLDVASTASMATFGFAISAGKIGLSIAATNGWCAGFIHSSASDISYSCLVSANDTVINNFLSETQFKLARDSYGKASSSFLHNSNSKIEFSGPFHNIAVVVNPADTGSVTGAGVYPEGETVTLVATPASGYQFQKWDDGITTTTRQVTADQDMTLTAIFMVAD